MKSGQPFVIRLTQLVISITGILRAEIGAEASAVPAKVYLTPNGHVQLIIRDSIVLTESFAEEAAPLLRPIVYPKETFVNRREFL